MAEFFPNIFSLCDFLCLSKFRDLCSLVGNVSSPALNFIISVEIGLPFKSLLPSQIKMEPAEES